MAMGIDPGSKDATKDWELPNAGEDAAADEIINEGGAIVLLER